MNGIEEEKEYFAKLRGIIRKELSDTTIRSPRSIKLIYQTLSVRIHWENTYFFTREHLIARAGGHENLKKSRQKNS